MQTSARTRSSSGNVAGASGAVANHSVLSNGENFVTARLAQPVETETRLSRVVVLHGRLEIIGEVVHEIDRPRSCIGEFIAAEPPFMREALIPASVILMLLVFCEKIVAKIDHTIECRKSDRTMLRPAACEDVAIHTVEPGEIQIGPGVEEGRMNPTASRRCEIRAVPPIRVVRLAVRVGLCIRLRLSLMRCVRTMVRAVGRRTLCVR